jgi:hypothetical protein
MPHLIVISDEEEKRTRYASSSNHIALFGADLCQYKGKRMSRFQRPHKRHNTRYAVQNLKRSPDRPTKPKNISQFNASQIIRP